MFSLVVELNIMDHLENASSKARCLFSDGVHGDLNPYESDALFSCNCLFYLGFWFIKVSLHYQKLHN